MFEVGKKHKIRKVLRSALWDIPEGRFETSTEPGASVTIPFPVMTCVVCGRQEQGWSPFVGDWRTIPYNDHVYFACPGEFPHPDAPAEEFQQAFQNILDFIGELPHERKH